MKPSLAAAAFVVALASQQSEPIRSGTDLVTVPFLAVAADGRPIVDLKAHEVSLRVGNRERTIKALEFVRLAGASLGGDRPPTPLPPPYATNRPLEAGRLVTIVLAHESIRA